MGHAGTGTTTPGLIKVDSIHIIEPGRNGTVSITEDGLLLRQESEDLQPRIKLTNIISLSIENGKNNWTNSKAKSEQANLQSLRSRSKLRSLMIRWTRMKKQGS